MVLGAGLEADGSEGFHGAATALGGGEIDLAVEEGELDVFERRGAGEEIEALEDEADLLIANE